MTDAFFFDTVGSFAAQMESIAQAASPEDMFDRLEACGYFLRLDKDVRPAMFKGATISKLEIAQLQRIKNVVRKGHVTAISTDVVKLTEGAIPTSAKTLHIECSASAVMNRELKRVLLNQREWAKYPELKTWIADNRLDGVSKLLKNLTEADTDKLKVMARIKENAPLAAMKLMAFKQAR